ncbi:S-adenosyl-L-methionine-dependent methyltransferase [Phaeosphaeria sp. MPI-PUGE-AT-0046c]|nr:S-adenosyl-L-methionine-dependent methyltransferase [Phaeosphaeria sp. MPI-PUGE-AT-0046c]
MPRIPTTLLRQAHTIDPLLPALLAPCRDLGAAQNELRWLREHVDKVAKARRARGDIVAKGALLRDLVLKRASGKPLQYILGTEYFGDLEIRCAPGVLIPRPDTAASVTHLVHLIHNANNLPAELRVLDLCTGTGCIPLLFQHELSSRRPDIRLSTLGVDVSGKALNLAALNRQRLSNATHNQSAAQLELVKADILLDPFADRDYGTPPLKNVLNYRKLPNFWDILISNPPYISPLSYWKTTTRSVRTFEPKLALVPPQRTGQDDIKQGDLFYPRLLEIARDVEAKIVLLEVADLAQATRVAQHAQELDIFDGVEIWRDDPAASVDASIGDSGIKIIGKGNARSVFCWRQNGSSWLGKAVR